MQLHSGGGSSRPTSPCRLWTFIRHYKLSFPHTQKKATSRCHDLQLVLGGGPWECGGLDFHWGCCIVVTVRLTSEIIRCSYRNPHRPGHNPWVRHKRIWISYDGAAAWEQTNLIVDLLAMCLNSGREQWHIKKYGFHKNYLKWTINGYKWPEFAEKWHSLQMF